MEFIKKINNNVAFARNEQGEDYIVLGKGIGFNSEKYIPKENIDRMFKAEAHTSDQASIDVLSNVDSVVVDMTTKVSSLAEKRLDVVFDNSHYLILADHFSFALKRKNEGIEYGSMNQWELKKMFPKEYAVAVEALDMITRDFSLEFERSEIDFITNHLVNVNSENGNLQNNIKMIKMIKKIVQLVEYHFQLTLNEESFSYSKFVSHLRYFILRKMNHHSDHEESIDEELLMAFQMKYPEATMMAEKIEAYLKLSEGWTLGTDEKLYLTVHVRRITSEN